MSEETPVVRKRVTHRSGGREMVKRADAEGTDPQLIVQKWLKTGIPPVGTGRAPRYGDFSGVEDFHTCVERVRDAEEDFMNLPSSVRAACQNDAGIFLDKVATDDGLEELRKQGLEFESLPEPIQVRIAPSEEQPQSGEGAEGTSPAQGETGSQTP
jgi:hypothetical protein